MHSANPTLDEPTILLPTRTREGTTCMSTTTRMSRTTRWWALLALGVAAMFFLAACDSDDDEADETTTPAASDSMTSETSEDMDDADDMADDAADDMSDDMTEDMDDADAMDDDADDMDDMSMGDHTVAVATEGDHAPYLVDGAGMTLYLFTNDTEGVSNCTGDCLTNWPPLRVAEGEEPTAGEGVTGELAVIERSDGGRQVTYNGMPLYYWQADQAPGDTTGHEVGGVWFVVHPDGDSAMSLESSDSDDDEYGY